ncbi:MAG: DNA polymerase Y family protein, partial [Candidatus Levyibacteriota bacterium]
MPDKVILHIDFDSFFASVEQQDNTVLRHKPIGITAANGRNAIIALSREAKALGLKSPGRVYEALQQCPSLILRKANFTRYFEISKKFLDICKRYSPFIEVFSIDELFMDITKTAYLFGGMQLLLQKIKQDIRREIGEYITVSIGVSHNRLLAKLASGMKKPDGVFFITKEDIVKVYSAIKLTDICGIGRRIEKRLNSMGVYNVLSLRHVTYNQLCAEFGPAEALFLQNVAWAQDETEVVHFGHAPTIKSVGRNYCLPHNEYNQRIILQNVFELCEEIGIKLRRLNKKAKTVGLSLRGTSESHGRKTIDTYINTGPDLFGVCKWFYKSWYWGKNEHDGMVRMMSVYAENLIDETFSPLSFFDKTQKQEKLVRTIDM